jgi:hypothetical protein
MIFLLIILGTLLIVAELGTNVSAELNKRQKRTVPPRGMIIPQDAAIVQSFVLIERLRADAMCDILATARFA